MDANLKIYSMDCSWRGCIVVVATSEETARELMSQAYNYDPKGIIEVHDIKDGFFFYNLGDM